MKFLRTKTAGRLIALLLVAAAAMPLANLAAAPGDLDGKQAIRTVKRLLVSIRLNKDNKALTYLNLDAMSRYLLGRHHGKFSADQKKRFESSLGEFMQLRAFPVARKNIGRLGLSYDKPIIKKKRIHVRSSLVWRGSEQLTITWVVGKFNDRYMVTDVLNIKGQSSLKESRDRQIQPIYRKLGAEKLVLKFESVVKKLRGR